VKHKFGTHLHGPCQEGYRFNREILSSACQDVPDCSFIYAADPGEIPLPPFFAFYDLEKRLRQRGQDVVSQLGDDLQLAALVRHRLIDRFVGSRALN
jgi:hypothetical protein